LAPRCPSAAPAAVASTVHARRYVAAGPPQLTALLLMHLPAHAFAAVDVLYQIEVVKLPAHRRWQVGDVPGPRLIGTGRGMATGCRYSPGRLTSASPMLLICRAQDAIKTRLAGQMPPLVGQPGHDLARRQRGKLWAVTDRQHRLSLLGAQGMRRPWANRAGPPIGRLRG